MARKSGSRQTKRTTRSQERRDKKRKSGQNEMQSVLDKLKGVLHAAHDAQTQRSDNSTDTERADTLHKGDEKPPTGRNDVLHNDYDEKSPTSRVDVLYEEKKTFTPRVVEVPLDEERKPATKRGRFASRQRASEKTNTKQRKSKKDEHDRATEARTGRKYQKRRTRGSTAATNTTQRDRKSRPGRTKKSGVVPTTNEPRTGKTGLDTNEQTTNRNGDWKENIKDRLHNLTDKFMAGDDPSVSSPDKKEEGGTNGLGQSSFRKREERRTGIKTKIDSEDQRRSAETKDDSCDRHPPPIVTSAPSKNSSVYYPPPEAQEFACDQCGDLVYFDRYTKKLLDPQPIPPPEPCDFCGRRWPDGRPYTQEIVRRIQDRARYYLGMPEEERMKRYGIKGILCLVCQGRNALETEETDDRGADGSGNHRGDHNCVPLDFKRDVKNVLPRIFPDDPKRKRGARKKALLIGINYSGQKHELKGCRNDVAHMYTYLRNNGYEDEKIDILMDIKPYVPPTRQNIINHMYDLVANVKNGDSLFFHYSGHGGQTADRPAQDGTDENSRHGDQTADGVGHDQEQDGKDETILPVDYKAAGEIIDDEMHRILTRIPGGVQLTALFDSCHSGSVLDLAYEYNDVHRSFERVEPRKPHEGYDENKFGTVILWSGCMDEQTSADAKINGRPSGAMSHAFVTCNQRLLDRYRKDKKRWTYEELLNEVRDELNNKYSQVAQLSSSVDFDTSQWVSV